MRSSLAQARFRLARRHGEPLARFAQTCVAPTRLGDCRRTSGKRSRRRKLSLVDDDTIEHEILASRLALAMMDRASWEFTDLRSRMNMLEGRDELETNDVLRPHVLARVVTDSWLAAPLGFDVWRVLQTVIHDEFSHFAEGVPRTNRTAAEQLLPYFDLGPSSATRPPRWPAGAASARRPAFDGATDFRARDAVPPPSVHESTKNPMLLASRRFRAAPSRRGGDRPAETGSSAATSGVLRPRSAQQHRRGQCRDHRCPEGVALAGERRGCSALMGQTAIARRLCSRGSSAISRSSRRADAGRRATSRSSRCDQSILMEDAIPATVRVWFARLQMPVLRVAVSEPDFFATVEHPARRLIDRMGAVVMGFDTGARAIGDVLEKEIKRVVQVVEAYPDTGRRVFQTVLTEFEKFLEHTSELERRRRKASRGAAVASARRWRSVPDRAAQDAQRRACRTASRLPVPRLGRRARDLLPEFVDADLSTT